MKKLGDAVRAKRKELGLNQKKFGELAGQSQTTISDWESGKSANIRNYKKLATILGVSNDEMLSMIAEAGASMQKTERIPPALREKYKTMVSESGNLIQALQAPVMDVRDVPVLGRAIGGTDGEFFFNGEIMGWETRPPALQGAPDAYAIYVDGESMYPRYKPGETVWVNPSRSPSRGDDVIVQLYPMEDGGVPRGYIKEFVSWTPEYLILSQHNPRAEVKFARDEVKSVHSISFSQK